MRRPALAALLLLIAGGPAFAFDLQGHRGARGLMPENTLPAFAKALGLGVTTLELDLGMTSGGQIVVTHDPRLNGDVAQGPDGAYVGADAPLIRDLTLAQIQTYDVGTLRPGSGYANSYKEQQAIPGTRIPRLADIVALAEKAGAADIRYNIEVKVDPTRPELTAERADFTQAAVKEIERLGIADRTTLQSFDWAVLMQAQQIAPGLQTAYLTIGRGRIDNLQRGRPDASPWLGGLDIDTFGGSAPKAVAAAGGKIWSPFFRDLTDEELKAARDLGLAVIPWTVNEPGDMATLIERGVDGIITDYPDRLRAVMAEKGMALPPAYPVQP
ncbi:glycerophosphodiester phosphodiesterase [Oceanibaculum pacificum]|uniref:Glycerophosphodiester phosphodiesterase n=1 Tax=Oceanibaculum pacificum TaxID=580166 RepID=A0A154WH63_9PROT|nr:glycerophosphodiester phosphodiesterase [Oceanibaculum pacificum]KZD12809.1 glycerophosphodiester phosphodiesterase [Oceanibaculum pacificum]